MTFHFECRSERDIIFLIRKFSQVSSFVIRSTRHLRHLCDTPPRSYARVQCDSLRAIHRVSRVCIPGARASACYLQHARLAYIHARMRLRNINNGESSPEWPTRPTPRGTIVRLLGRGFFPVFQPGRPRLLPLFSPSPAMQLLGCKPYNVVV